jgi:hypothetical protein
MADKFERKRIAFIGVTKDGQSVQMASAVVQVKRGPRKHPSGPPVTYSGNVAGWWDNYQKHIAPGVFDDLALIGAVAAITDPGDWQGHIDWVLPPEMETP